MPLQFPESGYHIDGNASSLPRHFAQSSFCNSVSVEFLQVPYAQGTIEELNSHPNHVVVNVFFQELYENTYTGVRISVEPGFDDNSDSSQLGPDHSRAVVMVRPIKYRTPSYSSVCTVYLERGMGIRLADLVNMILSQQAQYFYLGSINDVTHGCRDFVAQLLKFLITGGITGPRRTGISSCRFTVPFHNVYDILGLRFGPDYISVSPIDRGIFRRFVRDEGNIPYTGTYRIGYIQNEMSRIAPGR